MVRGKAGVGGPAGKRDRRSARIDHVGAVPIATTDAADKAQVMREGCECEVQPILWRNIPFQTAAAKDILPDEGHKGCMFRIMIQSVAEADALEDEPGGLTDDLAEARVASAVSLIVKAGHVLAECIGEYRGWSEHDTPLPS